MNNYFRVKAPEPKTPAIETSEYHYFPKTFKGEAVITIADFEHFTGVSRSSVGYYLKKLCKLGEEYFALSSAGIMQFKRENPSVSRLASELIVLKESAVCKLLKYFGLSVEIPMIEKKKPPVPVPAPRREYVSKREPSEKMKSLIERLHNEIKAIEGTSYMLLCPDTKENHEKQRDLLIKRINRLRDCWADVSMIVIE